MSKKGKPMPLSELSNYIKSVHEHGQGEEVPVVEMGMIFDDTVSRWRTRPFLLAVAASVFVVVGGVIAISASTESLTVYSKADADKIASIVADEGARVFSVTKSGDGEYKVKLFYFRNINSLLERLRNNKDLEGAKIEKSTIRL